MASSVLVFDDSRASRQFLCRVVRESYPGTVSIVETGEAVVARQALGLSADGAASAVFEVPQGSPFGLVVIEPGMPGGDGSRLLEELAHHAARKVVATVHGDDDHLRTAMSLGVDGYLLKHDPQDIWIDALRRLDTGQPALSPAIARRLMQGFAQRSADPMSELGSCTSRDRIPPPANLAPLTPRESEVLTYLSKGFTIREISDLLGIRWFTVNDHIKSIYRKLDVSSRAEAAVLAAKQGLV
jgi:DNA-binding NarL/FixJ family response regulator